MSSEGPYEFHLRARSEFIKSPGLNEAANLYFSLVNLDAHGLSVHPAPSTVEALSLLKEEDADVGDIGGGDSYTTRLERRAEYRRRKERGRAVSRKAGQRNRRVDTPGNTIRRLKPALSEFPSNWAVPDGIPPEKGLREKNGVMEWLHLTNDGHIPKELIDALYHYRPEVVPLSEQFGDSAHENSLALDHPLMDFFGHGIDGQPKWHSLFDKLYGSNSTHHVSKLDDKMRKHERKFTEMYSGEGWVPHTEMYGKYDDNSVGLNDLFERGRDMWRSTHRVRYNNNEGDDEGYLEYLKLKAEGVPEDLIYQRMYDEDGNLRKDSDDQRAELIRKNSDSSQQIGLLPLLLGLENLPAKEGKTAVKWFLDGAQGEFKDRPGSFSTKTHVLEGYKDTPALLHRIWRQRLGALTSAMTTPIVQPGLQQSSPKQEDVDWLSSREKDLWMRTLVWSRADKKGVHKRHMEENPSFFQQMMNDVGTLPNGQGYYGPEQPEVNEKLLDDWLKNGVKGVTKEQIEAVKSHKKKIEGYAREDWSKTFWAAPYHGPQYEGGSDSFAKVYHDSLASSGGMGMSPSDILLSLHHMYGGLFTQVPEYADIEHQRGPEAKKIKEVLFDAGETRGGGDVEQLNAMNRRRTGSLEEHGVVPLLMDLIDPSGELETQQMDYNPWLGPLMTKDRDLLSAMKSTGSPWYQKNTALDFAALPGLVESLVPYIKQRKEEGHGHKGRFGDNHHEPKITRRHRAQNTSFNLGSSYPHEEEHDLGDSASMGHLLDLVLGMFHYHGNDHQLHDEFRWGPDNFLAALMARRHENAGAQRGGEFPLAQTDVSVPHSSGLVDIGRLLEGAGLIQYISDPETGATERIADSPLDNAGSHALYHHDEHGAYPKEEKDGFLHGLEPSKGSHDSLSKRIQAFRQRPETFDIDSLLVHPHEKLYGKDSALGLGLGDIRTLRERLRGMPSVVGSKNPRYHRDAIKRDIRASAMRNGWDRERAELEYERAIGEAPPEEIHGSEGLVWEPRGHMVDFDRFPVLDPNQRHLNSDYLRSGLVGLTLPASIGGPYSENFENYLISSDQYQGFMGATARGVHDTGGGLLQETGGPGEDLREHTNSGLLLGPDPVTLMSDHIERLRDLAEEYPTDTVAREKIEAAMRKQQVVQMKWAMSNEAGLGDDKEAVNRRMGFSSMFLRMLSDTLHHTGVVAQALKKHYISEDASLEEKFGTTPEGYANHMELLHFANSLLHSPDQSWRKSLAEKMTGMGEESIASQLTDPHSKSTYISPKVEEGSYDIKTGRFEPLDREGHARVNNAFKSGQRQTGLQVAQHYLEEGHHETKPEPGILDGAQRAMKVLGKYSTKEAFLKDIDKIFPGSTLFEDEDGNTTGMSHRKGGSNSREDFNSLMAALSTMSVDARGSGRVQNVEDKGLLGNWQPFKTSTGSTKEARRARNYNTVLGLSRLYDRYHWDYKGGPGQLGLYERDVEKTIPFGPSQGKNGVAPLSIFSSNGLSRVAGTPTRPSLTFQGGGSSLPSVTSHHRPAETPQHRIHLPKNVLSSIMGERLDYTRDALYPDAGSNDSQYWDALGSSTRTVGQQLMSTANPNETLADVGAWTANYSLDVLTDTDLLLKKDEGDPPPIKPMHRIFSLEDLQYLRGFSDDWVVSAWPEGERLTVQKKGKSLTILNSTGKKVTIPNNVRKDLRKTYDSDFLIDVVWDEEAIHIVDVLKVSDDKVWDEQTKDRNRLLRSKFEATENVTIPAPINTKRTDTEGLQRAYKDLMKEKGVKQVLLRDAEATYMRGQARHPKWVLWRPDKAIDVLVVSSSGSSHCLGVGPIDEDMASKIGNRSQTYDGHHYMDIGSLFSDKVKEGDYITIAVSSTSTSTRKGETIYRVNAPRYRKPSESHATDSLDTLRILAPPLERNIPHKVRVSKGQVLLSMPTGDVIYETEEYGHGFIIKDVDSPDDYTARIAETQMDYWAPLASVLLRAEKEEEKEAVVPEPPANHDKDPKKVLKPKERLLKDPELTKAIIQSLELIDLVLKEKVTFTGAKGLGIDYGSSVESPHGPTENTEGYNLPDHDPGHRQEKGGECWCGAQKGQLCEQGRAHKMEDCSMAHPPRDESKDPKHLQFSHNSHSDSPA